MKGRLPRSTFEVGVDGDAGDPCQAIAREDKGPRVTVLARNARIDEDVLQLA